MSSPAIHQRSGRHTLHWIPRLFTVLVAHPCLPFTCLLFCRSREILK
jgi:hypothetical protein